MLKNIFRSLIILSIFLLILSVGSPVSAGSPKPVIITSIAPLRAILKEIVQDRIVVENLLPAGASPHTYEPKPSDIKKVKNAIAVFHVSHALDGWIMKLPVKKSVEVFDFVNEKDRLPLVYKHHHHGHDEHVEHDESHDAHFWSDPVLVRNIVPNIVDVLCEESSASCEYFRENSKSFVARLDSLDKKLKELVKGVDKEAVLLSHPFFFYFLKRYGFGNVEVIEKIPGKQPAPKELAVIFKFIKREKVKTVFTLKQLSKKPAQVVAESTGVRLVELDPIGGNGELESYEGLVLTNAKLLVNGLR